MYWSLLEVDLEAQGNRPWGSKGDIGVYSLLDMFQSFKLSLCLQGLKEACQELQAGYVRHVPIAY